jgi:ABC-type transport system involved in cytochrome c biogenesis permease subunit
MSTIAADPVGTAFDPPARPSPGVWPVVRKLLKPVASLQLTVALLAVAMGLIFFGTLAQKTYGIWTVVDKYFWSWVVLIDAQPTIEFGKIFLGLSPDLQAPSWLKIPYPGGITVGALMFANLLAAHAVRMKLQWRRAGVITLHAGIVLLFVGEFITRTSQIEQQMVIAEGSASNYAFDHRHAELAFVDASDPKADKVTVVSDGVLKRFAGQAEAFEHDLLPASVQVVKWFPNAGLAGASKPGAVNYATAGVGKEIVAVEKPEVSGVSMDEEVDQPAAYVTLYKKGTTEPLGTYLVAISARSNVVEIDGKKYELSLRYTHYYKPFTLALTKLHADYYPNTNPPKPKNYSSDVVLTDPAAGPPRPVSIAMNEPLRYGGETFYQSRITTTGAAQIPTTVLQVVRNPGWVLPYLACVLVGVGMLVHFGITLMKFLGRPQRAAAVAEGPAAPRSAFGLAIPVVAVVVAGLYVVGAASSKPAGKLDLSGVAKLPVLDRGRVKPLDSVARQDLRLIAHAETYEDANGKPVPAMQWYMDAASASPADTGAAGKARIFRVENDQLWDMLKLKRREGLRYSYEEIGPRLDALMEAGEKAVNRPAKERSLFDAKVLELGGHLEVFQHVMQGRGRTAAAVLPPLAEGGEWRQPGRALADIRTDADILQAAKLEAFRWAQETGLPTDLAAMSRAQKEQLIQTFEAARQKAEAARQKAAVEGDAGYAAWEAMLAAYKAGKPDEFRDKVTAFAALAGTTVPAADRGRAAFEVFLNSFAPFYRSAFQYGLAGLLTLAGWAATGFSPAAGGGFRRAAFWVLLLTFAVHTFGLVARMYLMDRWAVFVTNLYSSAVFIGWAAAGICLLVERIFPLGLGNAVAAALGVATNIVAHNYLSMDKDTLEMMEAVLDTNFWLATHVTTVALGYSATYVASAVGLAYVLLGVFTPLLPRRAGGRADTLGKTLGHVVYGIVCVAALFSFVGTVLGGIWADQSWGRFWGWDPKENGAVLIVAWNALILHARWCGLVKDRGVAVLAIAGAVVTTWSWFGTNQLGVGLHAYGFNNDLVVLCDWVWAVSLLAMLVGLVPTRYWVSFAPAAVPAKAAGRR